MTIIANKVECYMDNILRSLFVLQVALLARDLLPRFDWKIVSFSIDLLIRIGIFICIILILFVDATKLPFVIGMTMVMLNFSQIRRRYHERGRWGLCFVFFLSFLYFAVSVLCLEVRNGERVLNAKGDAKHYSVCFTSDEIISVDDSVCGNARRVMKMVESYINICGHTMSDVSVISIERYGTNRIFSVKLRRVDAEGSLQSEVFELNVDLTSCPNKVMGENPFKYKPDMCNKIK